MNKKYKAGIKVKVCSGSGLDSGRIGIIQDNRLYSQDFIKKNEPGRYKRFDSASECLIKDCNDNIFTMFKNRLIIVE
jgi:hypothetical protein